MLTIVKGIGLLLLTLACFSVFSLKFPKGSEAMSGMANAAVASFLVEAVHHYITGIFLRTRNRIRQLRGNRCSYFSSDQYGM